MKPVGLASKDLKRGHIFGWVAVAASAAIGVVGAVGAALLFDDFSVSVQAVQASQPPVQQADAQPAAVAKLETKPAATRVQAPLRKLAAAQAAPQIDAVQQPGGAVQAIAASPAARPTEVAAAFVPRSTSGSVIAPVGMKAPQPPRLFVTPVPEPSDIDADGLGLSATRPPTQVQVPESGLEHPRAPLDRAGSNGDRQAAGGSSDDFGQVSAAANATTTVSVYTPAQIRQAYGFASLPAATVANKSAYQGSGQIIVIVDAYHNATAGVDLNTFSTKFGLPTCTLIANTYRVGLPATSLVAKPKAGDGCSFQVLYVNSAGGQSATPPPVDSGWATEIALDVQWVHAVAPMAKIVLVEAASNSGTALMNAMQFASQLGGSSVSMSFGAPEFSSGPNYDGIMGGTATWVAASGDNGAGLSWPASSKNVLSVGGTLLGSVSPRAETAWSGSGGGLSQFVVMPSWQGTVTIPGNPANTPANASRMRRGVPDVAYNASPYSGFYVYQSGQGYLNVGGTSAGTPQWAALVAIVNGVRVSQSKTPFSGTGFQQAMYVTAATAANYRSNFLDVTAGTNGSCATCSARASFDLVTGLGTPNVVSLVSTLTALK